VKNIISKEKNHTLKNLIFEKNHKNIFKILENFTRYQKIFEISENSPQKNLRTSTKENY